MKRITRESSAYCGWLCEVTEKFPEHNASQVRLVVPEGYDESGTGLERWWFNNEDLEDA